MTDPAALLLRVAATWALPGLGLLALPAGPDAALRAHPLHAALAVEARLPGGAVAGTATVEELTKTVRSFTACCWILPGPWRCRRAPKSGAARVAPGPRAVAGFASKAGGGPVSRNCKFKNVNSNI